MTVADQIREHQEHCQPHLLRLQMLAGLEPGAVLPRQLTADVREATNAIIAEAETAGRAALAATAGRRQLEAETILWVRLAQLARAADGAVDAARGADVRGLRRQLRRFGALTVAICTAQHAWYLQAPAAPGPPFVPSQAIGAAAGVEDPDHIPHRPWLEAATTAVAARSVPRAGSSITWACRLVPAGPLPEQVTRASCRPHPPRSDVQSAARSRGPTPAGEHPARTGPALWGHDHQRHRG